MHWNYAIFNTCVNTCIPYGQVAHFLRSLRSFSQRCMSKSIYMLVSFCVAARLRVCLPVRCMCVCACFWLRAYMHAYLLTCTWTNVCLCVFACIHNVCTFVPVCMSVSPGIFVCITCVCGCICMYVCICVCVCVCVCVYIYIYIYTCIYIYMHIYTHIYM